MKLGAVVRSSPLPLGDRVFVGRGRRQGTRRPRGPRRANGKPVWRRKLGPVFSSPALAGGLRPRGQRRRTPPRPRPGEGRRSSGRAALSGRVRATPAVLGDVAVVARLQGTPGRGSRSRTAARSGRTSSGSPSTPRQPSRPALAVRGLPRRPRLRPRPGHRGARSSTSATGGPSSSSPLAVGDRFLAASTDGQLYLLDAVGPRAGPRWPWPVEGIQSSPALDASWPRGRQRARPARPAASAMKAPAPAGAGSKRACSRATRRGPATSSCCTATCATSSPSAPTTSPSRTACGASCARREVLVLYDVSSGFSFGTPAQEKAFRKALGLKSGPLPSDPARALVLLDALLTSERLPPGTRGRGPRLRPCPRARRGRRAATERTAITTLSRWATRAQGRGPPAPDRAPGAPAAGDVSDEIFAGASGAEVVEVPKPDLRARADFATGLRERFPEVAWELRRRSSPRRPAACPWPRSRTSCSATRGARAPLGREQVVERKIDLLKQEYGDVLEILQPALRPIGGGRPRARGARAQGGGRAHEEGRRPPPRPWASCSWARRARARATSPSASPRSAGCSASRFRPLRQMYVGQSERNQEQAFAAIRALAPVVVIVDESDQAEGGSRDQGSGDSGVTERMRAAAFNFWGDGVAARARCSASTSPTASTSSTPPCAARAAPTSRSRSSCPTRRRGGRSSRWRCASTSSPPSITGLRAVRETHRGLHGQRHRAGRDHGLALRAARRQAGARRRRPDGGPRRPAAHRASDQAAIDRMTLLALDECRNKRLLPRNHEQIRAGRSRPDRRAVEPTRPAGVLKFRATAGRASARRRP